MSTETQPRLRFLIVGVARSGTTLTQRLAAELDGVWVPPETHFWRHAQLLASEFDWPLAADDADALIERLRVLPGTDTFPHDSERFLSLLPDDALLWDVFEALTCSAAPPGTTVVGEKTPGHLRWTTRLLNERPELVVVGVRRDALSTFASHARVPWGERDATRFAFRHGLADQELLTAKHAFPDRVLLLENRTIGADPDTTRTAIASLLGIEPRLRPAGSLDGLVGPDEPWKTDALGDIEERRPSRDGLRDEEVDTLARALVGWDPALLKHGLPGSVALIRERDDFAAAHLPLPIGPDALPAWHRSAVYRAKSWEERASALSERAAAATSWRTRAEEVNQQLGAERTRSASWRNRALELHAEVGDTRQALEARVRELQEDLRAAEGEASERLIALRDLTNDLRSTKQQLESARRELNLRWTARARRRLRRFRRR